MTSSIILRLVRRWYRPDEANERRRRTAIAHERAIAIRIHSEAVEQRVAATRQSYERAGARLSKKGGHL